MLCYAHHKTMLWCKSSGCVSLSGGKEKEIEGVEKKGMTCYCSANKWSTERVTMKNNPPQHKGVVKHRTAPLFPASSH